uniref:Uncharacterized protein n=1 Tax=Cyclophora tenuis TaxID=216820 RepID=A0A7S1GQ68_CYCTE|mmetsp:Transcript_8139/g.13960  ORF Transcript_8139/g.13960 Transcript_8139/m.13960 type:complete len:114 (+) Transcript_8139:114-455(+)
MGRGDYIGQSMRIENDRFKIEQWHRVVGGLGQEARGGDETEIVCREYHGFCGRAGTLRSILCAAGFISSSLQQDPSIFFLTTFNNDVMFACVVDDKFCPCRQRSMMGRITAQH